MLLISLDELLRCSDAQIAEWNTTYQLPRLSRSNQRRPVYGRPRGGFYPLYAVCPVIGRPRGGFYPLYAVCPVIGWPRDGFYPLRAMSIQ